MIWHYIREISRIWSSWIFVLSGILGIYTQITNKNIPFYPWVYWVVAGVCFLVANYLLFSHQERIIKNYKAEEPNLVLTIIDSHIDIRDNSLVFFIGDDRPYDGLEDNGMPISLYLVANVEIENFGKEAGVFEWEISSIELGNIFLPDPEETKGKFLDFSGEVEGRNRYTGKWEFRLQPCKPYITGFAEILKNPQRYQVVTDYWTKKIGGRSQGKSVVISGELSAFVNEITDKWNKRGWGHYAQIANN